MGEGRGGDGGEATEGGVGSGSVGLQCGSVHGSHVGFCSREQGDELHRHPPPPRLPTHKGEKTETLHSVPPHPPPHCAPLA